MGREGDVIDAVREVTQRFVYKALPDAIGLRVEGREHMYAFSHMVWATMGPENELFKEAMVNIGPVLAWLEQCCDRDNLSAGGIDTSASVVDAVNVLLDLVKASGAKLVDNRRRALHSIADYCTTSKDITKYLEEVGDHSSRELVDAVLWCVGAVVVKSRIL